MKRLYIILLIIVPGLSFSQSMSPVQMDVLMKTASLRSALLNKDSAALSDLLSADVTYGHTNAMVQTKAQLIRSIVSGDQNYKSIEPSDMKVRVYENTGIVTMKSKVLMTFQGNPLDFSMNMLLVWIKKNNQWQLVARQSTKL